MDYPLENLGPERFQELCQALLVKEKPNVQCFPVAQPDGGRDALSYVPEEEPGKFIIYQVKYARHPQTDSDPRKWLLSVLKDEIPKVARLIPKGAIQYYLLTNIPGTAHLTRGAIDRLNRQLSKDLTLPFTCWWRDDINRRLDNAWNLKWVYPEIMTGPDFLHAILETGLHADRDRQLTAVKAFLTHQLNLDEEVRFKQVELQNKLFDLFIDVPIASRDHEGDQGTFLHYRTALWSSRTAPRSRDLFDLWARSSSTQYSREHDSPIGAAALLLGDMAQLRMPRVVLEGAPGQGKSTIAQFVCQVHRMKLLGESTPCSALLIDYAAASARLPIKIDLRDFAAWLSRQDPFASTKGAEPPVGWRKTLESFIAALISAQSGGTSFTTDDLLAVCRISAVLIVCDGLDEVADIGSRRDVVDEITKGIQRLEANSASLQTIITSRPAAFANSPGMPHDKFIYLQLVALTTPLINEYAERWLRARRIPERESNEFKAILRNKLEQPHLRDLARSPMQLTILLSLILARGASLPDKRTALYDNYVDVFLSREAEKSVVVREHRDLLLDIHRFLAWLLHSEAERNNPRASISQVRLRETVSNYLSQEGHDVGLADRLFSGVVERVFVLVSRVEGTFEFEVQPLREYFCARYLYDTAPYSPPGGERRGTKPDRFDAIARNFFWTNVTRFYAGCFSKGELAALAERLEVLASDEDFRLINYPRLLATTLLADWVFAQNPKSVKRVMDLLLDKRGFRVLLASAKHAALDPLVLPPGCGHEELIEACFDILKENPAYDFARELIDILRENEGGLGEFIETWIEGFEGKVQSKSLWLRYGLLLGVLTRVDRARLDVIIQSVPYDGRTIGSLYLAGRLEYLEDTEDHFERAIDAVLERACHPVPDRELESTLDLLVHVVDLYRYRVSSKEGGPVPLSMLWKRRGTRYPLSIGGPVSSGTESFASHSRCVRLAEVVNEEGMRTAAEWASEIAPWDRVVEVGRGLWGDRWAFYCMANAAAAIRSSEEVCSDAEELMDRSTHLCRRIRYARFQADKKKWWQVQFESARDRHARTFVSLVALSWAQVTTLVAIQDVLDEVLASLSKSEWIRVILAAEELKAMFVEDGSRKPDIRVSRISGGVSRRTIAAIAMRVGEKSIKQLVGRIRLDDASEDLLPNVFWDALLDAEKVDSARWSPQLSVIRQLYKTNVGLPRRLRHRRQVRPKRENETPPVIARGILEEAASYPSTLLVVAEECCRDQLARRRKAVADIADAEGWFRE